MRYLLLSSLVLLFVGCGSVYKNLQKTAADPSCLLRFKPVLTKVQYKTQIDVVGKHLSGILLIKTMPDSSTRILFSNEFGFKFFDFEFAYNGNFKVYYILKQMNKKAVIKTLRKDFELVMMQQLDLNKVFTLKNDSAVYYGFPQKKGTYYYITDSSCTRLIRMERSSKRKPVVQAWMENYQLGVPDSININHTNFQFNIGLKKLRQ